MKIIRDGDGRVSKILGTKNIDEKADYRVSNYSFEYKDNGRCFIKQTLTGQIVELTKAETELFLNAKNGCISGEKLSASNGVDLVAHHILVPQNSDELQKYQTVMLILQNMARTNKGLKKYTILPTTACNARCVYCYEEGMAYRTMSAETADKTVDFINSTRRDGPIKLVWFGGEPLAAHAVISRICEGLKNLSVPFSSEIVTNATLFTPELVQEAATEWQVKKARVSVDGLPQDYEDRKKYVDPRTHNYAALIRALHLMLDARIEVTLRCNYDRDNFPGLKQFAESIQTEFGHTDLLHLYFAMLFQERDLKECVELHQDMSRLRYSLEENGLEIAAPSKKPFHLKVNHCMADDFGESVVIDPDGVLYHCEHLPGQKPCGTIFDDPAKIKYYTGWPEPHEKCKACCFLPECTPFYKQCCPDYTEYCFELKKIDTEYSIKRAIKEL